MEAVKQFPMEGSREVIFAKDQPEYLPLPALVFDDDGRVLTEWRFTEEERARILAGENLRLWVWVFPRCCPRCHHVEAGKLQPVSLEITDEQKG